ncbi:MAG: asparagine synthase (glutamine-hydrolyzing) [Vicinamibacterales bacterium]
MCGIAGVCRLTLAPDPGLRGSLEAMDVLQRHRGPDGRGFWVHPQLGVGLGHRRLSIIDLESGAQPMSDEAGNWISFNGEIYNYIELRELLGPQGFRTTSDTEVILAAYRKWGADCVEHLRGMFAFVIWDDARRLLFCARDRCGIKPLHYTQVGDTLYIASEAKALLPFLPAIATDPQALKEYLAFQFCLGGRTLFRGISQLLPAHTLTVQSGTLRTRKYWEVYYHRDFDHTSRYFEERLRAALDDSVALHLRSDVPVGAYVSGGLDSSIVASLAHKAGGSDLLGFTGRFDLGPEYDESGHAAAVAGHCGFDLHTVTVRASDFVEHIRKVIYHLDYPIAGPGAFPQYMVARLVSGYRKVALGGQGGDEIFGGYTRYLIAYFEQCIKAAIDGTAHSGSFVVTYESIIPNLTALRQYKPLLQEFWRDGLFGPMDLRYFRLVNRASALDDEVRWDHLGDDSPLDSFKTVFNGNNVHHESYFDLMTHFDFKTLLPALLHVEDRMSMAHGVESRVPLVDHPLVELAATIPSDIKFKDGQLKHIMKTAFGHAMPASVLARTDKMGFPTPLLEFSRGEARNFVRDIFTTPEAKTRELFDNERILSRLDAEPRFGRKFWGFLSLELWQQEFHDREAWYKRVLRDARQRSDAVQKVTN